MGLPDGLLLRGIPDRGDLLGGLALLLRLLAALLGLLGGGLGVLRGGGVLTEDRSPQGDDQPVADHRCGEAGDRNGDLHEHISPMGVLLAVAMWVVGVAQMVPAVCAWYVPISSLGRVTGCSSRVS